MTYWEIVKPEWIIVGNIDRDVAGDLRVTALKIELLIGNTWHKAYLSDHCSLADLLLDDYRACQAHKRERVESLKEAR